MTEQHYLKVLFLCIAAWVGIFIAFTWTINPYGVSPVRVTLQGINAIKPKRLDIDRLIKPYEVWRYQPKTVFLGTSRIHQSIDPAVLENTKFAPAYNASIPASTLSQNALYLEQFFKLNRELRFVFVELFLYNFTLPQPVEPKYSTQQFLMNAVSLLASNDALRDSLQTILANQANSFSAAVTPRGFWVPRPDFNTGNTFDPYAFSDYVIQAHRVSPKLLLQPDAIAALDRIVDLCRQNGAELFLILTPNYPWDDYRLMDLGHWTLLEQWMRRLSTYSNVISFSQYNSIVEEPAGTGMRWWNDPIHFSLATGRQMQRQLIGIDDPEVPKNFLRRITPDTVEEILVARRDGLARWTERNNQFAMTFEKAKATILSKSTDFAAIGRLEKAQLAVEGTTYPIVRRIGGAIERAVEIGDHIELHGWAADVVANRPVIAIFAVIGTDIIARVAPTSRRFDIEQGLGSGISPAGFRISFAAPTAKLGQDLSIRVFALTFDGQAVQLASSLPPTRSLRIEPMPFPGLQ